MVNREWSIVNVPYTYYLLLMLEASGPTPYTFRLTPYTFRLIPSTLCLMSYLCRMHELKPLLTSYAYNILGIREDAEDAVQDVFLKYEEASHAHIHDTKAYLVRMVINRSLDLKEKRQKEKAAYPGNWLPEPIATETADAGILKTEVLSYSLLVLLEQLDARQRAVFILREAFDYSYEEIAEILSISTDLSRQLLSRARKKLATGKIAPTIQAQQLTQRYLTLIRNADTKGLEQLLTEDIRLVADGGGKASAALNPMEGRMAVAAFLNGIFRKFYSGTPIEMAMINHCPAILYYENGQVTTCQICIFEQDQLASIYVVRNPDKLTGLQKNISGAVTTDTPFQSL